jgi:hypothetical protein
MLLLMTLPQTPLACLQSASACLAAAQDMLQRAEDLAVRQCAQNEALDEFRRLTEAAWIVINEDAESAIQAAMEIEIEMADAGEVSAAEHARQERMA